MEKNHAQTGGKEKRLQIWRLLVSCLLSFYMVLLMYFLFFSENYGHGGTGEYSYNLIPFREIFRYVRYARLLGMRAVFCNLVGNVFGFLPFGFLVPSLFRRLRSVLKITLLGFFVSALVELSQLLFQVGCFDVDDMLLNALGSLLGYLVFRLVKKR